MLGIFLCEEGELGVEGGDALLLVVRESGTGVFEILEGFLDVSPLDIAEGVDLLAVRKSVKNVEEAGIEGERGVEIGDLGEERVEGFALGGIV